MSIIPQHNKTKTKTYSCKMPDSLGNGSLSTAEPLGQCERPPLLRMEDPGWVGFCLPRLICTALHSLPSLLLLCCPYRQHIGLFFFFFHF